MCSVTEAQVMVQPIHSYNHNTQGSHVSTGFWGKLKLVVERICSFVKSLFSRFASLFRKKEVTQERSAIIPDGQELKPIPIKKMETIVHSVRAGKPEGIKRAPPVIVPTVADLRSIEDVENRSAEYVMSFFRKSYLRKPQTFRFQTFKDTPLKPEQPHQTRDALKKFENICDVELREQAKNLFLLRELSTVEVCKTLPIQEFCTLVTRAADIWKDSVEKVDVVQARKILAKLILLTSDDVESLALALKGLDFQGAIQKVESLYTKKLHSVSKKICTEYKLHRKTGLQDETRALQTLLATEIAKCLIPAAGVFNTEIIPDVLKMLTPRQHLDTPHYSHICYVLKCLQESDRLWHKLQNIKGPESPHALSANLISIALDLPQGKPITDREAQKTALAGLLSHARQGKVGSCFASFFTTELLSTNLELCLEDYAALLRHSALTRLVRGKLMQFPFRLSISKDHVKQSIELDSTGKRKGSKRKLWHAPGIIAACKALDLDNPKAAILSLLSPMLLKNKEENPRTIKTTIDEVLQNLSGQARNNHHDQQLGVGELYLKALYAYESQTSNPLLQAWENVIAGMAKGTENSYIKPRIVDSVLFGLELGLNPKKRGSEQNALIFRKIKTILQKRIQLQFSPHVQHDRGDDDGNSSGGAFVVYDTRNSPHPSRWSLVGTPEVFVHFVRHVLDEVQCSTLKEKLIDPAALKETIDCLGDYVTTKKFIIQSIRKCGYHQIKNPVEDWQKIDNTPWMFKAGTNPKTVLQIYFELNHPPKLETFYFSNGNQLFSKLVEVVSKHKSWLKKCDHEHVMLPTDIQGIHVFSLLPKHSTFWPIVCSEESAENELEKKLLSPGKGIADRKVLSSTRKKIQAHCLKEEIPAECKDRYKGLFDAIPADLSFKDFLDQLLTIHLDLLGEDVHDAQIALNLDTIALKHLPEVQHQTLVESAIHFADTNWFHGVRNVHFCLMYNPRTGIELAKIDDNNENLTPIDQNYWLLAHPWEFYP